MVIPLFSLILGSSENFLVIDPNIQLSKTKRREMIKNLAYDKFQDIQIVSWHSIFYICWRGTDILYLCSNSISFMGSNEISIPTASPLMSHLQLFIHPLRIAPFLKTEVPTFQDSNHKSLLPQDFSWYLLSLSFHNTSSAPLL